MNDAIKVVLFLSLVTIILVSFIQQINDLFGGYDDCMICTPLHFNGYLSNWTISHLLVFVIIGYLCPKQIILIIFLGVLWEIIELYMEYISKTNHNHPLVKLLNLKCESKITPTQFWDHYFGIRKYHHKKTLFWCSGGFLGSILDIIADTTGAYIGIYLSQKF